MDIQQLATRFELSFWQVFIRVMSAPGLRQVLSQIRTDIKDARTTRFIRLAAVLSIGGWLLGILFGLLTVILQSTR